MGFRKLIWLAAAACSVAVLIMGCKAQEEIENVPTPRPASTASTEIIYLHQDKEEKERTISVTGNASVAAQPDYATIRVGVAVSGETAEAASALCAERVQGIYDAATPFFIRKADIQTAGVDIETRMMENGEEIQDYRARDTVTVTVRNVSKVNDILTKLIDAGASETYAVTYSVMDVTQAYDEALALAVEDALRKAEVIAASSGVTLNGIASCVEEAYDENSITGIAYESALIQVAATVQVKYYVK